MDERTIEENRARDYRNGTDADRARMDAAERAEGQRQAKQSMRNYHIIAHGTASADAVDWDKIYGSST